MSFENEAIGYPALHCYITESGGMILPA